MGSNATWPALNSTANLHTVANTVLLQYQRQPDSQNRKETTSATQMLRSASIASWTDAWSKFGEPSSRKLFFEVARGWLGPCDHPQA